MWTFCTLTALLLLALTESFPQIHPGLKLELDAVHHDFSYSGHKHLTEMDKKKVTQYFATIWVGSRNAKNNVLLDTGSSTLWVMGKDLICEFKSGPYPTYTLSPALFQNPYSDSCRSWGAFDPGLSHSFHRNVSLPPFTITYMDDTSVSGVWGSDSIVFWDKQVRMNFGVATKTSCSEGILGIGLVPKEMAVANHQKILDNANLPVLLKSSGVTKKMVYSLFLNASTSQRGSLGFGYVDHNKYAGQLLTVPIVNLQRNHQHPGELAIRLSRMYLENSKQKVVVLDSPIGAILDTGAVLQHFPHNVLSTLGLSMRGTMTTAKMYKVDCAYKHSGKLVYDFSGIFIKVDLDELILERRDECYLGIKRFDNDDQTYATAVLGTSFLRNAYVVFDLEKMEISMDQASYSTQEDLEEVTNAVPRALKAPGYSSTSLATGVCTKTPFVFNPVK